jgi:hypothetical protein
MGMSRLLASAALISALAAGMTAAPALADPIGKAVAVETQIVAGAPGAEKPLEVGGVVFADDRVVTNEDGVGQIQFVDNTRLVIGPGSTLTLDRFVYDPSRKKTDILIGFGRGSFRFITGKGTHKGYEIDTPTATIGVRGTAFDVYVGDDGDIAVAMISGTVQVCSRINLICRTHSAIGRFLHMTRDGVFSLRDRWNDVAGRTVGFVVAMPMMVNDTFLQPSFRAGANVIRRYADVAASAAGTVGRAAGTVVTAPGRAVGAAAGAAAGAVQRVNPFRRSQPAPPPPASRGATGAPVELVPPQPEGAPNSAPIEETPLPPAAAPDDAAPAPPAPDAPPPADGAPPP